MKKIVLIKWEDACYERGEITTKDIKPECILHSVGFLIKKTKTHISIAMDYDDIQKTWRHITHIPRKMILSIKEK